MLDWNIDKSWTLFLDRDGVINERKMGGYIETIDEFQFLPNAAPSIAQLSQLFNHVFVVTNQQGIGKKIMTKRNLLDIHSYMCKVVESEGGKITKCYFAPELKSENSSMRKPNSGMALLAKEEYPEVDFSKSIMVGDTDSDILFGTKLGMKTIRIKTQEPIGIESDLELFSLEQVCQLLQR